MTRSGALLAVCFVAGMLGALVSALFLWFGDTWGLWDFMGVNLHQTLNRADIQGKMMTGGLWALGYFFTVGVPRSRRRWIRKGLWFALIPAAVALFYIHPYHLHNGLLAFNLGALAPAIILLSYLIWGVFTGFFTRLLWGR